MAIHNYGQANKVFPPGTVCASDPIQPANQYDVWAEAGQAVRGNHGTGFLLRILPFIEGDTCATRWHWTSMASAAPTTGARLELQLAAATTDIKEFYCPTRRNGLRPGDKAMMLSSAWTGGGTDYGGCAGRHAAFTLETGYNLCDASMHYQPDFCPPLSRQEGGRRRNEAMGHLRPGQREHHRSAKSRDGLSNTIMTGELQRITDLTPTSKDGWAIGGPATLFTTGAMFARNGKTLCSVAPPAAGLLMNNGFFGSPGSDHPGGANFGLADGSVKFLSDSMDPNIFALMGSMADGQTVAPDGK